MTKTRAQGVNNINKVVVTRSMEGNLKLGARLRSMGFEPIPVDTMRFVPPSDWSEVDKCLRRLDDYDWLLFTSRIGALAFVERMKALRLPLPEGGRPAVAAVGPKTAEPLIHEGLGVNFVPSSYLTQAMAEELPLDRGRMVLMLRADIADPSLGRSLGAAGFRVTEQAIYRTSTERRSTPREPELDDADAIVFGSPSAVEGFVSRLSKPSLLSLTSRGILAVCIGPVTAKSARDRGFTNQLVPTTHTFDAVLDALRGAATPEEP